MFNNLFQRHLIVKLIILVMLFLLLSACVPTDQLPKDISQNQLRPQLQLDVTEVPAYPGPVDPYLGPEINATPTQFLGIPILATPDSANPGPTPTSKIPRPTALFPTAESSTEVPATAVPATALPPTAVPPTEIPPTARLPIATNIPSLPTKMPIIATTRPNILLTLTRLLPTRNSSTQIPPTAKPATPTWTPSTATPVTPTWTPSTATPVTPTWTPSTATPVTPTWTPSPAKPVTPTWTPSPAKPVTPTWTPPIATSVVRPTQPVATNSPIPTAVPIRPTNVPFYATNTRPASLYPTATPPIIVPTQAVNTVQHILQSGETLAMIADYYGVTVEDVAKYNNINNLNSLYVGQLIYIPLPKGAFAPAPPTAIVVPTVSQATTEPEAEPTPSSIVIPPIPIENDQLVTLPNPIALPDAKSGFYTIIDGNLVYWSATTNELTTIVPVQPVIGGLGWMPFNGLLGAAPLIYGSVVVIDYDVSTDGNKILVKRGLQSADQIAYELLLLDMNKGTRTLLVESTPNLLDIDLSADGEWVTYIRSDIALASTVLSVRTSDPTNKQLIGSCRIQENGELPCFGLFEGKDSDSILYTDSQGVWLAPFEGGEQKRLVENGKGGEENPLYYEPVSWSADHHFLLMKGKFADGTAFYVYDLETDQFELVPYTAGPTVTSATWLPNGRLLVIEPSNPAENIQPMLTVLKLQSNEAELFEEENRLNVPTITNDEPSGNESTNLMATAPFTWETNSGLFGLYSNELQERGVYRLDLDALTVQKINLWPTLPPEFEITEALWSPDGQGLLVTFESPEKDRHVFYVSISADTPLELPFQTVDDSSMMWQP